MSNFELLLQYITKDNLVLNQHIIKEPDTHLPAKKTLDSIDVALRNKQVRKIVIRKLSDYQEGDIF